MKKLICVLAVLVMSLALVCPALAAEDTFVPSISYKDGPVILVTDMNGENVASCLVITSLKAAAEKTTDISQEARNLLLDVYAKLESGELKIELEEGYIIRELVDLSWKQTSCVDAGHTHEADLDKEDVTVTVDFELGTGSQDELLVFTYNDGQWQKVDTVTVNDDGTVTCVFDHFCPVAFCVKDQKGNDTTADISGQSLMLWVVLMIASVATITVMYVDRRKHMR